MPASEQLNPASKRVRQRVMNRITRSLPEAPRNRREFEHHYKDLVHKAITSVLLEEQTDDK